MTNHDVQLENLRVQMEQNTREHKEIKESISSLNTVQSTGYKDLSDKIDSLVNKIDSALEKKADRSEFEWWRNLLVAGILLSIALGIWFKK